MRILRWTVVAIGGAVVAFVNGTPRSPGNCTRSELEDQEHEVVLGLAYEKESWRDAIEDYRGHNKHNITLIDLSHCGLGSDGLESLSCQLGNFSGDSLVHKLVLNANHINGMTSKQLHRLTVNAGVNVLHLDYNPLATKLSGLKPLTRQGVSMIKELSLRFCGIGAVGCSMLASGSLLKGSSPLERLCLCGNPIGDEGAEFLAASLRTNSQISRGAGDELSSGMDLDLSHAEIGDYGAVQIFHAVMAGAITSLSLAYNSHISEESCVALSKALSVSRCRLAWLDLSHTSIGDKGASILADGLLTNKSLKYLALSNVHLSGVGACAVAYGLDRGCGCLETLDLTASNHQKGNQITRNAAVTADAQFSIVKRFYKQMMDEPAHDTPCGLAAISKMVSRHQTLRKIYLRAIGERDLKRLESAVRLSPSLEFVDVMCNGHYSTKATAILNKALSHNG